MALPSACKNRIVVALSGGVDSSVVAYLLAQQWSKRAHRHLPQASLPLSSQIVGLFMNNWDAKDEFNGTTFCVNSEQDCNDAQSVCSMLRVPLHRANFSSEYWTQVFEPFLDAVENQGSMPNPDVLCNSKIKFGAMKQYAFQRLDATCIATGHYARLWRREREEWMEEWTDDVRQSIDDPVDSQQQRTIEEELAACSSVPDWIESWGRSSSASSSGAPPLLLAGADLSKDQSYFLSMTPGSAFKNVLFPLGYLRKHPASPTWDQTRHELRKGLVDNMPLSVREIAVEAGLSTAKKKESMGICFVGKRRFPQFISGYLSYARGGDFVCVDTGKVTGTHTDCTIFTIGQGAKISGASQKWFVAGKDPLHGTVYVCRGTHHPALYTSELYIGASTFNWIGGEMPPPLKDGQALYALCRIRHLQPLAKCEVSYDCQLSKLRVVFSRPIRGITCGQTAALYVADGLICLGGGPIQSRGPSYHELGLTLPSILHPAGNNDLSVPR